jgi:type III restriction enzyme
MKFRFDPDLEFQNQAIAAAVRLFEGAPRQETGFALVSENGVVGNRLLLDDDTLLANLQQVQTDADLHNRSPIPVSQELGSRDFSVEMETGTGKTYVYLRTLLELNQAYGFRKFIVVVPSVAIREGVLKTLQITREHFAGLYDNVPYRFYQYDSGNLARVRQFAASNDVEIMVMTLDSFNKDTNIFNRRMDRMMGLKPLELVRAARPILILDEPQNMESEIARQALASLDPLFKLRYSASHREIYNLIYRLTPVDAYNLRLVKQIEVASVVQDHDANRATIKCYSVDAKKTTISARLQVYVKEKTGPVPKTRTVRPGDDLYEITGLDAYEGFVVEALDAGWGEVAASLPLSIGKVCFANGVVVEAGEERGPEHEIIAQVQIAHTIEEHMRKAHRLRQRGIKVLSLFFIDEVANYTGADGYIRRTFEAEFNRLKQLDRPWARPYRDVDPADVQGSYFSEYKTESYMESDADAYDLIMRDKERLLSLEEPVAFIFSHSALREGWDNPNIFQICTLNRTISTIRKRQEIGRGMRLAVDQDGERVFDEQVNRLTVVANESYREYVDRLQTEYVDEVGLGQEPPQPKNARRRKTVRLKKGFELDPEFKELWQRVAQRTRYKVQLDTGALVAACAEAVRPIAIEPIQVRTTRGRVDHIRERGIFETSLLGEGAITVEQTYEVPNVTALLAEETHLTRRTLRVILERAGNLGQVYHNPAEYIQRAAEAINRAKRRFLVDGVQYLEVGAVYEMSLFEDMTGYESEDERPPGLLPIEKSIYEHVIYDSGVERDFAEALEAMDEVKLFVKLPDWFIVPTPIGDYNPDWAVVFHVQDEFGQACEKLYLVRETKGSVDPADLRDKEALKIACAERHFEVIDVDYDVVSSAEALRRQALSNLSNP